MNFKSRIASLVRGVARGLAWVWFIATIVTALFSLVGFGRAAVPNMPIVWPSVATATLTLAALLALPKLWDWVGKRFAISRYLFGGSVVVFVAGAVLFAVGTLKMEAAYAQTSGGIAQAKAAEAQAVNERQQAAIRQQQESNLAFAERAQASTESSKEKLSACLSSWSGNRELSQMVKSSLNNPRSYEYVETSAVETTSGNVLFRFRAENPYGAIMPAHVFATIDPETCRVTSMREIHAD